MIRKTVVAACVIYCFQPADSFGDYAIAGNTYGIKFEVDILRTTSMGDH